MRPAALVRTWGQVLVSDTAAALVADELPDDMALADLGVARLRDLARAERVWQLHAPGLGTSFPPLRFLDAAHHNLPAPLSSLIGRESELIDIARLLSEYRVVTLTGSGGVGKTRLAQQAAADAVELHPGGSWWVDLAQLRSAMHLAERVLDTVGLGFAAAGDAVAALSRHLRSTGSTLLVLDNAEHLVEAVANLTKRLLEACPEARLLVTSRESLGVPGETVWRVPALSTPGDGTTVHADDLRLSMRPDCSSNGLGRFGRTSCSTTGARRRWHRSARGWMGYRWRSSWPPPARGCCRSTGSRPGWTTRSGCSPVAPARPWLASRRCWRRSHGASTSSTNWTTPCSGGWRCCRAVHDRRS